MNKDEMIEKYFGSNLMTLVEIKKKNNQLAWELTQVTIYPLLFAFHLTFSPKVHMYRPRGLSSLVSLSLLTSTIGHSQFVRLVSPL